MKILHTSDWHIGHTLYDYDRHEEQQDMLRQLGEIVEDKKPDVLLVSGDIFHTSQPSAFVQKMLNEALLQIKKVNPDMVIVLSAGNHDSGSRHEISKSLWQLHGVHTIGLIDKEHPEKHILVMPGKGIVAVLPYTYERNIPDGFIEHLIEKANELGEGKLPVILSAHTTIDGCDRKGHERANDILIGGIESTDISSFGKGYDYLALGHIHKAQTLDKSRVRYSGSPLPVSFDESYPHSVSFVSIENHGDFPFIEEIFLDNPYPLITLPSVDTWGNFETVINMLKNLEAPSGSYIRLNIEIDSILDPEAQHIARRTASEKGYRFCLINPRRKETFQNIEGRQNFTMHEFMEKTPLEIVKMYAKDADLLFDRELEDLFLQAERDSKIGI